MVIEFDFIGLIVDTLTKDLKADFLVDIKSKLPTNFHFGGS